MKKSFIHYRTVVITAALTAAIMLVLLYAPSPFVVTKPGIAIPTDNYIQLANGQQEPLKIDEQMDDDIATSGGGQFLLTAVLLEMPNIWRSLGAIFIPGQEVKLKADVLGGVSIEEYAATVTTMMQGSHYNALEAAYRYLDIDYAIEPQHIVVQQTRSHLLSSSGLQAGDKIVAAVDFSGQQTVIASVDQFAKWIREQAEQIHSVEEQAEKKHASIIVERKEEQHESEIDLAKLDLQLANDQLAAAALDVVSFVELRTIVPKDEKFKLEIATDNIGGPSAGLVFALTIIDKLTSGDLAAGNSIAVTGTIDPTGKVGVIGGIVQKVYATSREGAALFIVPKGNEKDAKRTVKSIGSDMQIIGVSSLEETIEVLASLH